MDVCEIARCLGSDLVTRFSRVYVAGTRFWGAIFPRRWRRRGNVTRPRKSSVGLHVTAEGSVLAVPDVYIEGTEFADDITFTVACECGRRLFEATERLKTIVTGKLRTLHLKLSVGTCNLLVLDRALRLNRRGEAEDPAEVPGEEMEGVNEEEGDQRPSEEGEADAVRRRSAFSRGTLCTLDSDNCERLEDDLYLYSRSLARSLWGHWFFCRRSLRWLKLRMVTLIWTNG